MSAGQRISDGKRGENAEAKTLRPYSLGRGQNHEAEADAKS